MIYEFVSEDCCLLAVSGTKGVRKYETHLVADFGRRQACRQILYFTPYQL